MKLEKKEFRNIGVTGNNFTRWIFMNNYLKFILVYMFD